MAEMSSVEELEYELLFQDLLIGTLDQDSEDYEQRLAEIQTTKADLERQLADIGEVSAPPQMHVSQNGTFSSLQDNNNTTYNTPAQNGLKRTRQHSLAQSGSDHPPKRATPERYQVGSQTSSADSFDIAENPSWSQSNGVSTAEKMRQRQQEAEARIKREREDEELARRLSAEHSDGPISLPSFLGNNPVQTTIGSSGSYQRPRREDKQELPSITAVINGLGTAGPSHHEPLKQEQSHASAVPAPSSSQNLAQRSRSNYVVDLTEDTDDEDVAEPGPVALGDNQLSSTWYNPAHQSAHQPADQSAYQPIPGSWPAPSNTGHPTLGMPVHPQQNGYAQEPFVRAAQVYYQTAATGMNHGELDRLINGTRTQPQLTGLDEDDDSDIIYGGYRPLMPSRAWSNGHYSQYRDLYHQRYEELSNADPAKTKEEIESLLNNIRPDEDLPADLLARTPEAMNVRLHKYQELGLTWLRQCEDGSNKGGILADDMGLGKTIQMLSLIVSHKSENVASKTTLICAPVALLRQWKQEIQSKVKPTIGNRLTVFIHHGASKKSSTKDLMVYDIVLTTYGSLASEVKKTEKFALRKLTSPDAAQLRPTPQERCVLIKTDIPWYRVILDEAQYIKNRNTQSAKGACLLNAKYRFCCTGTPMMNNVEELFSLVHFLRIKPYCQWEQFRKDFNTPLKSLNEPAAVRDNAMQKLQTVCKAIMLRRTKKSEFEGKPILILPERSTEEDNPEFNEDELDFYRQVEGKSRSQFNKYLRRGEVGGHYSAILVLLLRLRQACCHPHLLKDFGVAAVADLSEDQLIALAKELPENAVARIKEGEGSFECPVCYDAAPDPAIFIPCGHFTCRDDFVKITDAAVENRANEGSAGTRCPVCRAAVDPKRITDFSSFKKVHWPEMLLPEEQSEGTDIDKNESGLMDSDSDSESESETDVEGFEDETLDGFIVNDDVVEEETASGSDAQASKDNAAETDSDLDGPVVKRSWKPAGQMSRKGKEPASREDEKTDIGSSKKSRKSKKSKGKQKKEDKVLTLAELKKLGERNAAARKRYLKRLRKDWKSSAKIDKTLELLNTIMSNMEGDKVLVFSQWTSLLDLLEIPIDGEGWRYRRYDGSMNPRARADAVDDFRDTTKNVKIMLVSLKAGNAGLNLNMANHVIILDPFWNPYIEEQAIDRAHRLGQQKPVHVHRILIKETVEDRIVELQEKKRALISEALDEKAGQNIARLGVQELAYLFGVTSSANETVQYVPRNRR